MAKQLSVLKVRATCVCVCVCVCVCEIKERKKERIVEVLSFMGVCVLNAVNNV